MLNLSVILNDFWIKYINIIIYLLIPIHKTTKTSISNTLKEGEPARYSFACSVYNSIPYGNSYPLIGLKQQKLLLILLQLF